jgi:mono/diheme cytochrome c family protein
MRRSSFATIVMVNLVVLAVVGVAFGSHTARAAGSTAPSAQYNDPVKQGEYLTTVAGCRDCHTPRLPDGAPDLSRAFAGGFEFVIPGLGSAFSGNLTSDKGTGLGNWTDEQIKTAIATGVTPDGRKVFPVMPYHFYSQLAESDLDAIVAFLRTVPAVSNAITHTQLLPPEALPQVEWKRNVVAPDPSDTAARGKYLMTALIACADCHTPLDPKTGAADPTKHLAGGQPYEGPWGIVYGRNITFDKATGIGNWTEADFVRLIRQGVRPDGRRVVVMPWQEFAVATDADLKAMYYYLQNDTPAIYNQVPEPSFNPGVAQYVELPKEPSGPNLLVYIAGGMALIVVVGGAVALWLNRQRRAKDTPPSAS